MAIESIQSVYNYCIDTAVATAMTSQALKKLGMLPTGVEHHVAIQVLLY